MSDPGHLIEEQTSISSNELLARYVAGERDFRGVDIDDQPGDTPLAGRCLDGADFSGAWLVVDFSRASLRGALFIEANVKTCTFDGADLTGTDFSRAALCAATFLGARLEGAIFQGAFHHSVLAGEQRGAGGERRVSGGRTPARADGLSPPARERWWLHQPRGWGRAKRIDLLVRWPYTNRRGKRAVQRAALELKVWRDRDRKGDPLAAGLVQLDAYLAKLGLSHGVLVIFDARAAADPVEDRTRF